MVAKSSSIIAIRCGHPDRKHHAHGMCYQCYQQSHRGSGDPLNRHPELVLGFIVQKNCILCGDGMPLLDRECQLHPDICNTCEREYCECQALEQIDLMPLEEI